MRPRVAEQPSRYHVIRRLAVGGMGEIFLAQQAIAGVDRLVVLKRLLPELADDPQQLAMFIDEARIAANLAHPGIVQVHEFGQDEQGYFIVMEYVAGHNLGRLLGRAVRAKREIATRVGAYIICEVARALDHAHLARDSDGRPLEIVHRDISPSNILVSFRGDVKLMDFGIARAANRAHRTSDGSIRGKFAYMAPEQIEGREVDATTDVFAMGVVLWELTLGRRLFEGSSDFETIRASLEQPIPRPTSLDADYPAALEQIVMAALDRDRASRLPSAGELALRLKAFLRTQPADRDDVATLMVEMFPDEAAESVRLEAEHTRPDPRDVMPTAPLSPPPAESELHRPRGRRIAALLAIAVAGSAGAAWVARGTSHVVTVLDAAPHVAAIADSSNELDALAIVDAGGALVITTPDAGVVPRPDHPHHRPAQDAGGIVKLDAGPLVLEQPVPEVAVKIGPEPGEPRVDVRVIAPPGVRCNGDWLTLTCYASPGSYPMRFRVTNGEELELSVTFDPATPRCFVSRAAKRLACH